MDLVSVVIPYFKKREYIKRCIQSVLRQNYKKFEYIDKDSKNIGFYKHVYLEEKVEVDEFYSDIFSIYYIFDPEKRNSFYITCTVGTYSVDGKPVEKHSEKTISECKNIIQSARPK